MDDPTGRRRPQLTTTDRVPGTRTGGVDTVSTHCEGCAAECVATAEHLICRARHLYQCAGWSTRRVAAACGVGRVRITALLREAGIPIAPRGAGRCRPHRIAEPGDFPAVLTYLYVRQRLSSADIAAVLGVSERLVRLRLAQYGIRRRTKGRFNREDRTHLEPEQLQELAVRKDLPATDISRVTDTGYPPILRDLHTVGLPVRLSGNPPTASPARIAVIRALYEDREVRAALDEFGVPIVPPGGQLWERFPVPITLSADLLDRLYVGCGLSSPHIELLTGHPVATVLHHLARYGIPRRRPGGRSPFMRRWRAEHPVTTACPDRCV